MRGSVAEKEYEPATQVEYPSMRSINEWTAGRLLSWYLMCSYLYYILDTAVIPDEVFDAIAARLHKEYDSLEHPHKHLVSKEDLSAGTLYSVRHYPTMIMSAASRLKEYDDKSRTI